MSARRKKIDTIYDPSGPILHSDIGKRLDAAIRRLGGKPKAELPPSRIILPTVGKFDCEGQMTIFDEVGDERSIETVELPEEST